MRTSVLFLCFWQSSAFINAPLTKTRRNFIFSDSRSFASLRMAADEIKVSYQASEEEINKLNARR